MFKVLYKRMNKKPIAVNPNLDDIAIDRIIEMAWEVIGEIGLIWLE